MDHNDVTKNKEENKDESKSDKSSNSSTPRSCDSLTRNNQSKVKKTRSKSSQRCQAKGCKKKLGLVAVICRCGMQFCGLHINSNRHDCTFDYKELGRQEIMAKMPKVIAQKVIKFGEENKKKE